ncbi:hypothetical protein TNIN_423291 [Trichonephila inaurata madagascariensis]|uniref:Uncharacterized protein n=1 Tax=Trichonephila inaurata madagascariensis TaxID=2747483 RepID=A0A8X6Y6F6_9ARAC|nr:hypothetical protein TNIN_423291 [Trichonephila inaurata madagascariensis]
MNISDLDCPQYVCFDSEAFQKELLGTSVLSADSLEETENAQYNTENSTLTSEDLSDLTSNCEDDPNIYINEHQEPRDLGTSHSMETENCSYCIYTIDFPTLHVYGINLAPSAKTSCVAWHCISCHDNASFLDSKVRSLTHVTCPTLSPK